MIIIYCTDCNEVVPLVIKEMRYCKCKASGGMYINQQAVEIEGLAVPIELALEQIQVGVLRRRENVPFCFEAYIMPDDSPLVTRQEICYRCRTDQCAHLDPVNHPANNKDNQENSQGYQVYKCRVCGEYHGCRYQYNRGCGSDSRWAMLGKDPAKVKRHY